jgi:diguanylate cyclase (GGDEF)-like protein/PAS domain S-box-containing protein
VSCSVRIGWRWPAPCTPVSAADPRSFRLLFAFTTGFLILAAIYITVLIVHRQQSLYAVSRYNASWLLSQAALEVARLAATVGATAVPDTQIDPDDVRLWLDVVGNRLRLLESGEVREFIQSSPDLAAITGDFRDSYSVVEALVNTLQQQGHTRLLLEKLAELSPKLTRLASGAYTRSGELAAADLAQLSHLHWMFSGVLLALVICSLGLIVVLSWHNRLLSLAHVEVRDLLQGLTGTTRELSIAEQRTHQAMAEVQLQNEILQARDRELNTQNSRFDAALNNMSQALCMIDGNQRLIVCNVRFMKLFGLSPSEVQPNTHVRDVFHAIRSGARYSGELVEAIEAEQQRLISAHKPGNFMREIHSGPALAVSHQPMTGGGWVATYEDITERHHAEARIRFMAHHDALTNLPNRVLFHIKMEELLRAQEQCGAGLAILCLDLDHFKNVNDTLGHPVGDALLQAVAGRLRDCMREEDVVARIGGDEFAILVPLSDNGDRAELLAQRIVWALNEPFDLDSQRAVIGVSIGIALATEQSISADVLLKNADMALYSAKSDGRSGYRFFEPEMDAQMQARRTIELDLREAMSRQELEVWYQPIFDLAANRVTGFEALLRWRHPEYGIIPPVQFIPLAEELGLIAPIGEWVLLRACQDAVMWPGGLKVAVNLSPVQFGKAYLVETVEQVLTLTGLAPNRLELEITETVLLKDSAAILITLHQLRNLGLRVVLDDFGTGYSSLSYLRSFPFDKLKIDQTFVREMATRPDCLAIVNSIASLASQLNITTTAEGVETAAQLDQVRRAGCHEVQGYYFDYPRPTGELRYEYAVALPEAADQIS